MQAKDVFYFTVSTNFNDDLLFFVQVILDCAVGGSPMPEILWTKDGKPVTISNRIQQLTNGSLVIKNSIVSSLPNK